MNVSAILTALAIVVFLLIGVVLILTILIQRPMGGGLSGAFGAGGGSGQTAFGTKTGDALTIATIVMFTAFVVFAVGLNYALRPARVAPGVVPTATPSGGGAATGSGVAEGEGAAPGSSTPAEAGVAPEAAGGPAESPVPAVPAVPVPSGSGEPQTGNPPPGR